MTDAKEAAERIVAYWQERGITDPAQCSARNLDELRVALALLAQPGEEEVKEAVRTLTSTMSAYAESAYLAGAGHVELAESPAAQTDKVAVEEAIDKAASLLERLSRRTA